MQGASLKKGVFVPKSEDLSQVQLPPEVDSVVEIVAKNVHDVWAESRLAEGWSWGEKYDHDAKLTPNLVPYEKLPESEKDYDRNTALGTMKMLYRLGFEIKKKQ